MCLWHEDHPPTSCYPDFEFRLWNPKQESIGFRTRAFRCYWLSASIPGGYQLLCPDEKVRFDKDKRASRRPWVWLPVGGENPSIGVVGYIKPGLSRVTSCHNRSVTKPVNHGFISFFGSSSGGVHPGNPLRGSRLPATGNCCSVPMWRAGYDGMSGG